MRKYSGEQELIWGDNHCEHRWDSYDATLLHENRQGLGSFAVTPKIGIHGKKVGQASFCSLCGAWKGAYGLEPTPEMYIEHTIEILREIRRVLRKDGVCFLNLGDSYAGSWGDSGHRPERDSVDGYQRPKETDWFERQGHPRFNPPTSKRHPILKPKDLCLIPFRVAIAAQEDGWWVRSVIIWSKPNPMPESVTDRPTESHEYILLLTKSSRYYWDADAVREPYSEIERWGGPVMKPSSNHKWANDATDRVRLVQPKKPQAWEYADQTGGVLKNIKGNFSERGVTRTTEGLNLKTAEEKMHPAGRNIRSVWEFPTQPYPQAHFAVFPEKLPEICIKAATPEVGCCSKCGAPWERIMKVTGGTIGESWHDHSDDIGKGTSQSKDGIPLATFKTQKMKENPYKREELGWQPTCKCNAEKVPSIVLDPFMGAGTTLWVAKKLNRWAVGYEISEEYCQLAVDRCRQQVLL